MVNRRPQRLPTLRGVRSARTSASNSRLWRNVAAAEAVKDSLWLQRLLRDLGQHAGPVTLYEDNTACIAMAPNEGMSPRTKHVDRCHHLVRDCVERQQVVLEYVPAEEQRADGLTKALPRDSFTRFRE